MTISTHYPISLLNQPAIPRCNNPQSAALLGGLQVEQYLVGFLLMQLVATCLSCLFSVQYIKLGRRHIILHLEPRKMGVRSENATDGRQGDGTNSHKQTIRIGNNMSLFRFGIKQSSSAPKLQLTNYKHIAKECS